MIQKRRRHCFKKKHILQDGKEGWKRGLSRENTMSKKRGWHSRDENGDSIHCRGVTVEYSLLKIHCRVFTVEDSRGDTSSSWDDRRHTTTRIERQNPVYFCSDDRVSWQTSLSLLLLFEFLLPWDFLFFAWSRGESNFQARSRVVHFGNKLRILLLSCLLAVLLANMCLSLEIHQLCYPWPFSSQIERHTPFDLSSSCWSSSNLQIVSTNAGK